LNNQKGWCIVVVGNETKRNATELSTECEDIKMQVLERKHTSLVNMPDDDTLVQRVRSGDEKAFEILVNRYQEMVFKFIYRFLGDYDQAADVSQFVFLQLYLSMPTLRLGKPLKPWLMQVARNRCLDELRKRRVLHFSQLEASEEDDSLSPLSMLPDPHALPDEIAEHHDLEEVLLEAIQSLPSKFCSVVLLRYKGQLTFGEIGRKLNMPEATAKTYFQRARLLLRNKLSAQLQA
jgi:RNA polymerase sigma-70 factor (ECF subfamily)